MALRQSNKYEYICCSGCGLLFEVIPAEYQETVLLCSRCSTPLMKRFKNSFRNCLIFSLSGLILFYMAIYWPILDVSVGKLNNSTSLVNSLIALFDNYPFVSLFSLLVVVIVPLLYLLLHFYLSFTVLIGHKAIFRRYALIVLSGIREWYMIDVFLVSILISIIKLKGMFEFSFDPGFYFLLGLCLNILIIEFYSDIRLFWKVLGDD